MSTFILILNSLGRVEFRQATVKSAVQQQGDGHVSSWQSSWQSSCQLSCQSSCQSDSMWQLQFMYKDGEG